MPYIVFALKWRPRSFDEVVGQPHVVNTLKSAIAKNRLAHAYLFAGPRGVGKTSCARILAKSLNCQAGPAAAPCGKCPSCVDIAASRSLDVMEIDGASNRGIDEIRTLRENVKFSPTQGKYKIYIIDEVHQITSEGFNALLKTLEEPPEFVKFIFATTHPQKIPSTILSRCQRLDFRRISTMEIISQLEKICKQEKISVDKEVLAAIARSSDGALRDAESILDQLIAFAKDKISLSDVVSMLGLVEQNVFFEIADKIRAKDARGALEIFNNILDQGKDLNVFLTDFIEHFRNLMVAKVSQADTELIDLPDDICKRLLDQSRVFSLEEIFNIFNVLVGAQDLSKKLQNQRMPLEICLVKLAADDQRSKTVVQAEKPQVKVEKRADPVNTPVAPVKPASVKPAPVPEKKNIPEAKPVEDRVKEDTSLVNISLENVKEGWVNFVSCISKVKISVGTYLNEGEPVKLKGNALTISFPKNYSFHKESLEGKENREIIEGCLADVFGARLRALFILSEQEKNPNETHDHPIVKDALDMFKGRVLD